MNPMLKLVASGQGGVFSRSQAFECGYTPQELRDRVRSGRWERLRHGQYAEAVDLGALPIWDRELVRHRRLVFAAMNSLRTGAVAVSHQSALVLHQLPQWDLDLSEVHLSRLDERRHSGRVAGVRHHRGRISPADLVQRDGLPVTTVARAIVETACTTSFEAAVVIVDAALRDHAIGEAELLRLLDAIEFWPGGPTARSAIRFGDAKSESVGESRLRVLMHNHRLPRPELQVVYEDADGFVARVDFAFPEYETVVEFDGRTKYASGSPDVLFDEKVREDRLRALGLQVVRVRWSHLAQPSRTAAAIRAAFARSRRTA
ncbi:type IV toxin-antitoxin system AbiEi family antitoxin domain-containing protein [Kribbella sp. NPDC004875]|uniref:type IV toxin-antitoxin system AbiEi family antitoxin domain-containing protein n=1 Tax=Kribbella sp. NPDC004875 TaxID=3364107 RepID=UPI0036BB4E99